MHDQVDLSTAQSRSFIDTHPDPLEADSTLYIRRSHDTNADQSENHTVTGVHLIFKKGEKNKLYDSFHVPRTSRISAEAPKVATKSLLIACDILEIHDELSLPECDVSIYARRLVFKGKGHINTSPLPWDVDKARDADPSSNSGGRNGAHGRNAGHIKVFVSEIDAAGQEQLVRFIASGGKGQHPGRGKDGRDGHVAKSFKEVEYKLNDSDIKTTYCKVNFDPAAYYVEYEWRWGLSGLGSGRNGTDKAPTSGTDSLPPGVPGNAGDGGAFLSNQPQLAQWLRNPAGLPGNRPPDVRGGAAGWPRKSAKYKLTLWHNLFNRDGTVEKSHGAAITTAKGKDHAGKAAAKSTGKSPKPLTVKQANSWLHPLQLQTLLEFIRDSYLAGQRDSLLPLLLAYDAALRQARPDAPETGAVWQDSGARWQAAQTEIATLLQRQIAQLDYFGNPAGYMPLLSLQSNMRLYDIETDRALRTLLLSAWVKDRSNQAQSAGKAFGDAIEGLQEENTKLVSRLKDAEESVDNSYKQLDALRLRLAAMSGKLGELENTLYSRASQDLANKALIKGAIKMAGAICQVIPVGQPALGTVGKLGGIAADMIDGKAPDTISKMGDTIDKAKTAADKSKETVKKAKKDGLYEEPSKVSKLLDGLGPALSQAGEAIGALQVPQSEVEAELEKLKAQSPEWEGMVMEIRALNEHKSEVFAKLISSLQVVGEAHSRLANNAEGIFTLRRQRSSTLAKLDLDAVQSISQMEQKARISLQRALYLMVKSYETTVLKPINVNWKLDKVLQKINTLLKPDSGFDGATINAHVKTLKPIFEDNLNTVRNKLLDQYGFNKEDAVTLEFGLTREQTEAQLQVLNESGALSLDPLALGLVLPGKQRMSLAKLELTALEYDAKGPDLPASGNLIISLLPEADGTIRFNEKLYAVRSDAARPWTWTNHFSSGKTDAATPSTASLDLLNAILGGSDDDIKQKLAAPPLWSELKLRADFSPPLPKQQRPRITKLIFKATMSTWAAPASQRVLDLRCVGARAELECSPRDSGDRGAGFGNLYRIYEANSTVRLAAPETVGRMNFSHWKVMNQDTVETRDTRSITLELSSHTLVHCCYEAPDRGLQVARVNLLDTPEFAAQAAAAEGGRELPGDIRRHLESRPKARAKAKSRLALATVKAARVAATPATDSPPLIRISPSDTAPVVSAFASPEDITLLETLGDWHKVQYGAVIGYCRP